ncbi:acyl carrier protein [Ketobacter sp.]|uniref:acyl carrier protein n=1 Tax=Ketobacter sp. TaxID=2083498 RepID=UPI000F262ECD|nr:acyl carrier protein [Ketobacter sp.]RLT93673.1 MAG: acyl carrier protein [Ketobacter sp.]
MSFNAEQARSQLLEFIVNSYMVDLEEIPLDESLIDEGIIDSFGLVEIATFLEKAFKIKVAEEDMIRENFGSVNKLIAFAERKQNS